MPVLHVEHSNASLASGKRKPKTHKCLSVSDDKISVYKCDKILAFSYMRLNMVHIAVNLLIFKQEIYSDCNIFWIVIVPFLNILSFVLLLNTGCYYLERLIISCCRLQSQSCYIHFSLWLIVLAICFREILFWGKIFRKGSHSVSAKKFIKNQISEQFICPNLKIRTEIRFSSLKFRMNFYSGRSILTTLFIILTVDTVDNHRHMEFPSW